MSVATGTKEVNVCMHTGHDDTCIATHVASALLAAAAFAAVDAVHTFSLP